MNCELVEIRELESLLMRKTLVENDVDCCEIEKRIFYEETDDGDNNATLRRLKEDGETPHLLHLTQFSTKITSLKVFFPEL